MVRPIEITDTMTKAEAVQRVQQNQKVLPEAAQHLQRSNTERMSEQVTMPNPVQREDEVVLHVNEREKDNRDQNEDGKQESSARDDNAERDNDDSRDDGSDASPHDHIDITI